MTLEELETWCNEERRAVSDTGPAFKTVATFAELTRKKLWLNDAPTPSTNGRAEGLAIHAPFNSPYFYRMVEHALAHILFESNAAGRAAFITQYLDTTTKALAAKGLPPLTEDEEVALKSLISTVVGLLEDARVESLWGQLYPGSLALLREMSKAQISTKMVQYAHRSLEAFLIVSAAGLTPPTGPFTPYAEPLKEALLRVEQKSFAATLVVAREFVARLVDERLRELRTKQKQVAQQLLSKLSGPVPPESATTRRSSSSRQETGLRRAALGTLLETGDNTPSAMTAIPKDWAEQTFQTASAKRAGVQTAAAVMDLKLSDPSEVEGFLKETSREAEEQVQEILQKLKLAEPETDKSWLSKDARAQVNFTDVSGAPETRLEAGDLATVNRLRSIFVRVQGRKRHLLRESGLGVDVSAYVAGSLSRVPEPCFVSEEPGRGYKVLLLLDRSASMAGEKTVRAERACRVLSHALRFPFVELHVWGFQAHKQALDLTRFDRQRLAFQTENARVGGSTPLHLALRVGTRFMSTGSEFKQIIILTDGWPSHGNLEGSALAMQRLVRAEVTTARRLGMHITTVVIGKDMTDAGLNFMLGANRWKRMQKNKLGDELIRVVTSSFTQYLRAH